MRVLSRSFSLQKEGNTPEEYEDACWPDKELAFENKICRFAVADGATETSYSALWARQLVRAYCEGKLTTKRKIKDTLTQLQRKWRESVGSAPMPWYAEEKLLKGAFSSLVGLTIRNEKGEGKWRALAVGDSCLFQVRKNQTLINTFPLSNSEQFSNRPALLSTNPGLNDPLDSLLHTAKGDVQAEDHFYLMTDAIACWFLRECEQGHKPWLTVKDWGYNKDVDKEIQQLRREKKINNDDVTVVVIDIAWITK